MSQFLKKPNNYKKHKAYANWERNQVAIAEAYVEILKEKERRPKVPELIEKTGLTKNTVRSHLDTLEKKEFSERWKSFRLLSDKVILSQAVNAIRGGRGAAASAKLFLEVVEQIKLGMKIQVEGEIKLNQMTTEELIQRHEEHGKLLNSKLLRFARDSGGLRNTGSN